MLWVLREVALHGRFRGREMVTVGVPFAFAGHVDPATVVTLRFGGESGWKV